MPYSKAHKARTHARIVEAAAQAFREEGINSVGIPAVMRQAGLTHGGFYAHFESKDALVADACTAGFAESAERLVRKVARMGPDNALRRIIDSYLSPQHRDMPASGCAIPTLAGEVARSAPEVREAFTQGLADYARQLGSYLPATGEEEDTERRMDDALVLLSGLAGALLLARAVSDEELSERILAASRAFYTRAFSDRATTETAL